MNNPQNVTESQNAECLILKKRLNTIRTAKGTFRKISDQLVVDIVKAWERWPGTTKSFYQGLGIKKQQLAIIIKKAKKLHKDNKDKLGSFTPVPIAIKSESIDYKSPIILIWDKKKTIKFYQVGHLVDFLKQVA